MVEADLHDLSDDPDYAASQRQGLAGSMHGGESTGVSSGETVYYKDNVAIHPTQFASERISGRLRLTKHGSHLFMSWTPYKPNPNGGAGWRGSNSELLEKDRNLYMIRDFPLTDVHSIRRHTPALGWQYIIVVLSSGLAYPPLYFYNGGVREFLAVLKHYISIVRSADDANVFLVNDFKDPLQRTLSSLELPGVVSTANTASSSNTPSSDSLSTTLYDLRSSAAQYRVKPRQKLQDPAHDLSLQVLEKFSLVTKFARDTTAQLFGDNSSNGFNNIYDGRPQIAAAPVKQSSSASNEVKATENEPLAVSDSLEIDKLSLVWGKPRQQPLGFDEWATFFDSEGRIVDSEALKRQIFYGGLKSGLRKEAWKFLLGYYSYDSTYAEREYLSSVKKKEYETIKSQWKAYLPDAKYHQYNISPGTILLQPNKPKDGQRSISAAQARKFTKFRERKGLIEKDVVRTDRSLSFYDGDENPNVMLLHDILMTYSFYNFDLGYCQGMSDFLSPILFVMEDESEVFWCFTALMEHLGPNFNRDQSGMHSQLFALSKLVEILDLPLHNYFKRADCLNYFFCFRWILIQFKREFEYEQVMRLWEVLWTHYLSEHLHLYLCVAILKKHCRKIIDEEMDFDTLLKFINELSGHIDLDRTIRDAEALCICAGENGAACIPPGTPPSLPLESAVLYPLQDEDDFGKTGCV